MITDTNYYQISGWMINRLNLKGNELQAYAIIYGFTQDGQNWYTGSLAYLSDWLNCSSRTCINILASLVEKGLLLKESWTEKGVPYTRYRANMDKLFFLEKAQKAQKAKKEAPPKPAPPELTQELFPAENKEAEPKNSDIFEEYAGNDLALLTKLREFEKARELNKAKMTDLAKVGLVSKLKRAFNSNSERIEALEEAMINGWKSVYPEKGITKAAPAKNYNYDYSNTGLKEGVDYL